MLCGRCVVVSLLLVLAAGQETPAAPPATPAPTPNLAPRVSELEFELNSQTDILSARTKQATQLGETIASLERTIAEREQTLSTKNGEINAKNTAFQASTEKLLSMTQELAKLTSEAEATRQQKASAHTSTLVALTKDLKALQASKSEIEAKGAELRASLAHQNDQLKVFTDATEKAKDATEQQLKEIETLREALRSAQKVIDDPSLYDWFNARLEISSKTVPSIASVLKNATSETVKRGLGKMRGRIESKLKNINVLSKHSSLLSLACVYFFTLVPFLAFLWVLMRFSAIVSLPHVLIFADMCVLFMSAFLLLFALLFEKFDPLAVVDDESKLFHKILAAVYFFFLLFHLLSFFRYPGGVSLFQISGFGFIGSHYYSRAWYQAVNNAPTQIVPGWYICYMLILALMTYLSFSQLTRAQTLELESMLQRSRLEITQVVVDSGSSTSEEDNDKAE